MESSNVNNDDFKNERVKDDATEATKKIEDRENKIRSSNRKQNQLLMELLETELNYVDDLQEVCKIYLPFARDPTKRSSTSILIDQPKHDTARRVQSWSPVTDSEESSLQISRKQMRDLLGNIEDLRDYHKTIFCPKLEIACNDTSKMRDLFVCEKSRLGMKYGRYCINTCRSNSIIQQNISFFSDLQSNLGLKLRLDALLIKPVQRITRYHMFLQDLLKVSKALEDEEALIDYTAALDAVLGVAEHTNTMMWVGEMASCPFMLCGQGPLLKHGKVLSKKLRGSFKNRNKWSCHLILFQQTLVLCRVIENTDRGITHKLEYFKHINVNHIYELEDEGTHTLAVKKLEHGEHSYLADPVTSKVVMRLEFGSEEEKMIWKETIKKETEQLKSLALCL